MSHDGKGFVAVYRWRVAPEHEAEFRKVWIETTEALSENGGLGSLLGRAPDGTLCAVALWPSAEARTRALETTPEGAPWPPSERLESITMDVMDDMWAVSALRDDGEPG